MSVRASDQTLQAGAPKKARLVVLGRARLRPTPALLRYDRMQDFDGVWRCIVGKIAQMHGNRRNANSGSDFAAVMNIVVITATLEDISSEAYAVAEANKRLRTL